MQNISQDSESPENSSANPAIRTMHPFEFTGKSGEFFRIWIVNLLLTVLTLGIYSAWAKVRSTRYFYSHTLLDGSAFEYTADPVKILKGRLIAVLLLIIYSVVNQFFPGYSNFALLVLMLILPIIIVMSMSFRFRYSSWRGIRFGFKKDYRSAYLLFLPPILYIAVIAIAPLLLGITPEMFANLQNEAEDAQVPEWFGQYMAVVGIAFVVAACLFPWWQRMYFRFIATRGRFGNTYFTFSALTIEFYSIYFIAFLLFVLGMIFAGIGFAITAAIATATVQAFAFIGFIWIFIPYVLATAYVQAQRTNVIYSNLNLDDIAFNSTLETKRLAMLYATNTVAILCTLGLAIPWAMIRVARYRASRTQLLAHDFSGFTAAAADSQAATGEEIGDLFGFDLGL